ncbi:MAG: dCTP deaminase [Chloroflexi bacterium]|nr:dCTP deaminase [Chloroflexota bacterium]
MVILSDRDIRKVLAEGKIRITPNEGLDQRIGPDGIDLRLGHTFLLFERNKQPYIDPRRAETAKGMTRQIVVKTGEQFIIHPNELVLASTLERIGISDDLLGRLEGRSSLGRLGIIVHSTASIFHPGWDGTATMELGNLGVMPVALYPRMRICMFTFERMSSRVDRPYGSGKTKYQGQTGPQASSIWDELEEELAEEALHKGVQPGLNLAGEEERS